MALEDLTGSKYIDALNASWPEGTDYRSAGDDHLRGIKNVLKKTFPSVDGPITLTDTEINRGSVESGSKLLFYQAAAPTGWVRATVNSTYGVKVQKTADAGGSTSGSDDPVLNNKTPNHTHPVSGNTAGGGAHNHQSTSGRVYMENSSGDGNVGWTTGADMRGVAMSTASNHTHPISLTSGNPGTGTVGNWVPRHMNMILCTRS
jgi:hypothetical protein